MIKKLIFWKDQLCLIINRNIKKLFLMWKYILFFVLVIFSLSGCTSNKESEIILGTFTVSSGDHDRFDTPIRFECKSEDLFGNSSDLSISDDHYFMLYEKGGKRSKLPVQWEPKTGFNWEKFPGQGALVWILYGKTPRGSIRTFRLVMKKKSPPLGTFHIEDIDSTKLLIRNGTDQVLQYNYGIIKEKENQSNIYDRSSYIHPVWTPSGEIITGDFSPEHIWQRGIFLAWQKVNFGDKETNFWELGNSTGRILKDEKNPDIIQGPVFTELIVYNKGTIEDKTFFKEICVVRLYERTKKEYWNFDISFRQLPVDPEIPDILPSETKIMELQKVYYGGMSFRGVSPGWLHRDFIAKDGDQLSKFQKDTKWLNPVDSLDILTSQGYGRKSGNGTSARWIDYTGPLGDKWGGLAMFDNPSNRRYPAPLRIHPDMPYFCFAFVKDDSFKVTSEEPLNLTYRIVVHNGHPDKEFNEQISLDLADPPHVTWQCANKIKL